jgi:aspartyl-tRNA(Asn)/glutamyl-tRNA(Gln) amidotransferase subunit C
MAEFDKQALDHLKKLCRIDCSAEEEADILKSLKRILEYVKQLDEVETSKTAPCNQVQNGMARNRWREDVPHTAMSREKFLANAPDQIAGMIRVPPVLKPQ